MARKRRNPLSELSSAPQREEPSKYGIDETFDDSEDEFFAGRDKVLLEEGPAAKRRKKLQEQEKDLELSDEEIYQDANGIEEEEEEDSALSENLDADANDARNDDEENESDEDWGASRSNYYNTDVIETEADALEEEAEARRLRLKQLKGMTAADFGFDQKAWTAQAEPRSRRPAVEKLPDLQIPDNSTSEERLKLLKSRYPEFEPLSKDYVRLKILHDTMEQNVRLFASREHKNSRLNEQVPAFLTKYRALSAYLAVIATYLAMLTSSKTGIALPPSELREHPIMNTILRCRQAWTKVEDWPDDKSRSPSPVELQEPTPPNSRGMNIDTSVGDEPSQEQKAISNDVATLKKDKATKKRAKKTSQEPKQVLSTTPIHPKEKSTDHKPKRLALEDLLASATNANEDFPPSDFGDEAPLTIEQAAAKAQKKRSLRFYTSQIAQKANKRNAASREAGGDDDIPHKERLRDKQDRLQREAEARGKSRANARERLDDHSDDDDKDLNMVKAINNNANDNEYYDSLVANSQRKKAEKKARAEAVAQGGKVYRQEEEEVGPDGKRKITYAIEKNKGLAPKRKKDVRNPRVKKRKKFDEKVKKLGTIRQVYKGGEGRGGYGGELSGIKTNVVKSIKL